MKDNEKHIEEFVKDIPFHAPDDQHSEKLKKQLLNAFPKHRLQATGHAVGLWRVVMRSRIPKLAAAAVIIIAVFFGLNIFSDSSGVAWAEVLNNVQKVQSYINRMKMTTRPAAASR